MGCRSVELDCWDDDISPGIVIAHGKDIPMVGRSFVSPKLDIIDVVRTFELKF